MLHEQGERADNKVEAAAAVSSAREFERSNSLGHGRDHGALIDPVDAFLVAYSAFSDLVGTRDVRCSAL